MKDTAAAFTFDLDALDRDPWMAKVEDIAEDHGMAEPIGPDYISLLIDGDSTLLVSFESAASARRRNDESAPLGWQFVQSHGWSSLTLLSEHDQDWFRHPAIFGYFDRLIDDGFFDGYDTVLFYGAGAAGYAAAAFSVAAPDSKVLAIQPQATLDPALSRWDHRYPETRRSDFTSRFGYGPMMVETADQVWVIHDPSVIEDAMHASLYNGDNTTHLSCPYIGPDAHRSLMKMDVLPDLIEQAMQGALDRLSYAKLWRARQTYMPYLRTVFHRLDATGDHPRLQARLCRQVAQGGDRPLFADKLTDLQAQGVTL